MSEKFKKIVKKYVTDDTRYTQKLGSFQGH